MYTHGCTKCKAQYQDSDPDAYLCAKCISERRSIASNIDAQFANRPHVTIKSDLQVFEENGKTLNVEGRTVTFNRA